MAGDLEEAVIVAASSDLVDQLCFGLAVLAVEGRKVQNGGSGRRHCDDDTDDDRVSVWSFAARYILCGYGRGEREPEHSGDVIGMNADAYLTSHRAKMEGGGQGWGDTMIRYGMRGECIYTDMDKVGIFEMNNNPILV